VGWAFGERSLGEDAALAIDGSGAPRVLYRYGDRLAISAFEGWSTLPMHVAAEPAALAFDEGGALHVAYSSPAGDVMLDDQLLAHAGDAHALSIASRGNRLAVRFVAGGREHLSILETIVLF